jgi:hypothetical protein
MGSDLKEKAYGMERAGYESFIRDEVVFDPCVITPARYIWLAYSRSCVVWGFPAVSAKTFMTWLGTEPKIKLRQGGSGRIRTLALGVYVPKT